MSLDRSKLQMMRELGNGGLQARCPACAESGQDRKGEHLRISPDGKFGCCVYTGDHEHRKRIFALAGDHGPKTINVRVTPTKPAPSFQLDLLGRLGRVFSKEEWTMKNGELETGASDEQIGTLGTCISDPRAYANKPDLYIRKLIGSEPPVPSVPEQKDGRDGRDSKDGTKRLPFLMADGTVVIPFNSPERYHWWRGGQSVRQTVAELKERKELDASPF